MGGACSTPGCKSWSQGIFPTIGADGTEVNGGVPQNGNLTAHLDQLNAQLPMWIPDPEWEGNAVFDFEAWTTVWAQNTNPDNWHGARYQQKSIALVKAANPAWPAAKVEAAAKEAFETAATEWFVKSLEAGRKLRPKAKWGFYGLPENFLQPCSGSGTDTKCSYDGPDAATYRAESAGQAKVWAASTALYPSVYLSTGLEGKPDEAEAYLTAVVAEGVRCGTMAGGAPLPVYPYAWHYYHDGKEILPVSEVVATLEASAAAGASGVVMWGGSAVGRQNASAPYWQPVNFSQNTFPDRARCVGTATARILIPAECSAVS